MKVSKKLLSVLLALAMVCSLAVPAMAEETQTPEVTPYTVPADVEGKIVILHTNDTHGGDVAEEGKSIGTAGVAQLKKDFEAAGAKVILMSAGDAIQGQPLVSLDKGVSEIGFMNAAGYDVMTLGNHEMDYGYDNLKTILADAEFPLVAANVLDEKTDKPVFDANKIFELDGVKIGVFGMATPETSTKADATKMKGLAFPQTDDLYACAQAQVDELKAAGCDLIVALAHLGVDAESVGNRSIDMAKNVNGIDLIVDGHSHSTTSQIAEAVAAAEFGEGNTVNGAKIVSTGTALANVGVVIYDPVAKTLTDSLVSAKEYSAVDEAVAKLVNDRAAAVDAELSVVFAETEVELNGAKAPGNRTEETNLGDFATDAILWQAREILGEDKVDAALTNGGGIRAAIPAGDINMKTMKTVFPFGNTVATIDVTGAQLLEALEASTYCTPEAIGGFPQVAGIEYTVDTTNTYDQGELYKAPNGQDSTYYAPKSIQRVEIATVNGEAFDPEATYTIATNDFTAKGNDTYGIFTIVGTWKDLGIPLEDALINYTKDVLGGKITAEQYGKPAGRITIKALPADVPADSWYAEAVLFVMDEGFMQGTNLGFEPKGTVTVATVFQTLYNIEGKPTEGIEKAAFTDIEGKWYEAAANWAASVGLASGDAFNGNAVITRSQIATVLANYLTMKELTVEGGMAVREAPDYDQVPEADLAGVGYCYEAGIMVGDNNGNLNPTAQLTRAEWAKILCNLDAFVAAATAPAEADKAA